jgi:hypothetical protein
MAKKTKVRIYAGERAKDGTRKFKITEAKRNQVLEALNTDPDNRPSKFKDVPATFSYFNYLTDKEGNFTQFLVRLNDAPVTPEVTAWVETIVAPAPEEARKILEIRTYRPPRKNAIKVARVKELLDELGAGEVFEGDENGENHQVRLTEIRDLITELLG